MAPNQDAQSQLEPEDCDTADGYNWFTCTFGNNDYRGCCKVDPCSQPKYAHCPAKDSQPTPTAAPSNGTTSTTIPTNSSSVSSTIIGPASSTDLANGQSTGDESSSSSSLPVAALVGIVLGCFLLAAMLAIWLGMRCARHRRGKKDEQAAMGEKAEKAAAALNMIAGNENGNGMDHHNSFVPAPYVGPRLGNHDGADEKNRASGAAAFTTQDVLRTSHLSTGPLRSHPLGMGSRPQSSQVSPLTANSLQPPWRHSELASNPVHELDCTTKPVQPVELDPQDDSTASSSSQQPAALDEPLAAGSRVPTAQLRATLNATQHERASNTYSNSWSKFYNVQV